tara:strand:- start:1055 stop:2113 length:1059 start_codon:yes stop_codon:yes gene_type:complete
MGFKKYAYYNKGNKIAIVESDTSGSGGSLAVAHCTIGGYSTKDTCEAAGGQWIPSSGGGSFNQVQQYISPKTSINNGLEIEYSYAPTFNLNDLHQEGADYHKFLGWGSDGINLLFFTFGSLGVEDLSSVFIADDWVYIEGSGRWSGLHQVKETASNTGILTLKTKCNIRPSKLRNVTIDFMANEHLIADNNNVRATLNEFTDNQNYISQPNIFIENSAAAANNGFFRVNKNSANDLMVSHKFKFNNIGERLISPNTTMTESADDVVNIYNVFDEEVIIHETVEVMEDESFELDITNYQAQAVIYYLKAKISEEMRDMDAREYFMRLFYKQIEKSSKSKKTGIHIIQGNSNLI